jgi:hypothetical protein
MLAPLTHRSVGVGEGSFICCEAQIPHCAMIGPIYRISGPSVCDLRERIVLFLRGFRRWVGVALL